ncbi:MAG: hypothetical protein AB7D57_15450 [Desulfovibrionaceae bacterium]
MASLMRSPVRVARLVLAAAATLVLVSALAALLGPCPARADRMDIRKPAYAQSAAYEAQGWSVKDEIIIGELAKGRSYYFDVQLTTGLEYLLHFQGDAGAKALRLEVYDEEFRSVGRADTKGADPAVVRLAPQWSGTYHVKATLTDCRGASDFWFLLAGYR